MGIKPDLVTRFNFNDSVIVEITADGDSVLVEVSNIDDPEDGGRSFILYPDEIDLFISALNLYKNRIEKSNGAWKSEL